MFHVATLRSFWPDEALCDPISCADQTFAGLLCSTIETSLPKMQCAKRLSQFFFHFVVQLGAVKISYYRGLYLGICKFLVLFLVVLFLVDLTRVKKTPFTRHYFVKAKKTDMELGHVYTHAAFVLLCLAAVN